jgi:hypothetical protein
LFAEEARSQGLLDDFNRPDGSIGGNWTVRAGEFRVVNNAAQGGPLALATYDGITSGNAEADVAVTGTALQYVGLVLGYADINNTLFLKVQQQEGGGAFDYAACYIGNNGAGFGPGFFRLDAPFSSAHMRADLSDGTVTITFSNIDGGDGTQTYICEGAPSTGGNGIGIVSFDINYGTIDNFASGPSATQAVSGTVTFIGSGTGPISIAAFDGNDCGVGNSEEVWITGPGQYALHLTAGEYYICACRDTNHNGSCPDPGEPASGYIDNPVVVSDTPLSGINILLQGQPQRTERVPTMTQWGFIIFLVLAGIGSVFVLGRRVKR